MEVIHLIIGSGIIAILYGIFTSISVISADAGNEKMQEIAKAIQEGASAYLARQYSTIALVGIVIFYYFIFSAWFTSRGWIPYWRSHVWYGRLHRNVGFS